MAHESCWCPDVTSGVTSAAGSLAAALRDTAGSVLPSGGGAGAPAEHRGRERGSHSSSDLPGACQQQSAGSQECAFINLFTR